MLGLQPLLAHERTTPLFTYIIIITMNAIMYIEDEYTYNTTMATVKVSTYKRI